MIEDRYTPFGYLNNPYHYCKGSYYTQENGCIRSSERYVGLGWSYPWGSNSAKSQINLVIGVDINNNTYMNRRDFSILYSSYHTENVISFDFSINLLNVRAIYFLIEKDEIGCILELENQGDCNINFNLLLSLEGRGEISVVGEESLKTDRYYHSLGLKGERPFSSNNHMLNWKLPIILSSMEKKELYVPLLRSESLEALSALKESVRCNYGEILKERYREDEFYLRAPILTGDWAIYWKKSWHYDWETTRMCVMPPQGIFKDRWPTWTIQWPRVVLAEGTMDMMRLSYADKNLAQECIASLLKYTITPNIPCIFMDGSPNMIAKDGSICGTSPAWCLPFYNIYLMYLRYLDREWLMDIYPYLANYLNWWLKERTTPDGWIIYKCTWESGEDGNPRLDPDQTGDNVISNYVYPVELQASMAISSLIMERFAQELSMLQDVRYWNKIYEEYKEKTQRLWDSGENRFRDWDIKENRWSWKDVNYGGVNPFLYEPLHLIPLMFRLATEEQVDKFKERWGYSAYDREPFNFWPSWTYTICESANHQDDRRVVSEMAYKIIDRVYRENDRRFLGEGLEPLPGEAREYWPQNIENWRAAEVYGWGATTLTLLIRQIMGFLESEDTKNNEFIIAPQLPKDLLISGKIYGLENLHYRGYNFAISYQVEDEKDEKLLLSLKFQEPIKICIDGIFYNNELELHIINGRRYKVIISD